MCCSHSFTGVRSQILSSGTHVTLATTALLSETVLSSYFCFLCAGLLWCYDSKPLPGEIHRSNCSTNADLGLMYFSALLPTDTAQLCVCSGCLGLQSTACWCVWGCTWTLGLPCLCHHPGIALGLANMLQKLLGTG